MDEISMSLYEEICPHCKGRGIVIICPRCGDKDVEVHVVPGMWKEWRCEKCGFKARQYDPRY